MKVEIIGNELVIKLPVNNPLVSSSTGKSLIVASTSGNKETEVKINGASVILGVNAYIKKI
jgi:hypothetical protein